MINPSHLIPLLDLTYLGPEADQDVIEDLCAKALKYKVAAVCVMPQALKQSAIALSHSEVRLATVANFPTGDASWPALEHELMVILAQPRVQEIDIVIPYQSYIAKQDNEAIKNFVARCRSIVGPHIVLKMILESGAFPHPKLLKPLSLACLEAGANFLKTSTGKIPQGASLEAAEVILDSIQAFGFSHAGFKVSGGVKTFVQAQEYAQLILKKFGPSSLNPAHFRIGASSLLAELIET